MSKKIRVALCTTELRMGGAERILVELATRLDRDRFEPFVCCMKPQPQEGEHSLVEKLNDADVPIEFINFASPFSLLPGLFRLRNVLKQRRPQLFQSFLFHANLLGRLAAKLASVPHILSGIRVAEREKRWHLSLDRMTQRFVERYVCVSKAVADYTVSEGSILRSKVVVIPNGIDIDDVSQKNKADLTSLGCSPSSQKIIVIGRLHHQKGIDWLLQTTHDWLDRFPNRELLIVGEGPERSKLELMVQALPSRERIFMLGHRRDVPELLAAADLLVLPSRWEGMPNVVMQAMAAGLPVVSTEVEGIDELLKHDRTDEEIATQTCKFGDTATITTCVHRILNDANLTQQLGAKNRACIENHFTIQKMVNAYEQLWLQLLVDAD